jgi:predicted dehydrogenase
VIVDSDAAKQIAAKPRLGFLGVGWSGRNRLEAVARSGVATIAAVSDCSRSLAAEAAQIESGVTVATCLEALLELDLDGIVIATPRALHAEHAIAALEKGVAVFCQKPLGRNATETRRVVEAARGADVALGTDFSYRHIGGLRRIHELCRSGEFGDIYAADLIFHNAYGPDKKWFYDPDLSGGGCVIDLGIHLIDLALWNLDFPEAQNVSSRLFAAGKRLRDRRTVEDYALAQLDLETGASVRLTCSWRLPAGCDAVISGSFYGTKGSAAFHNVNGSFHDFIAEQFHGTRREALAWMPESWGGRAAIDWASRLASGEKFDREIENAIEVARVLDLIYEQATKPRSTRSILKKS